jgi:hypothetical protein
MEDPETEIDETGRNATQRRMDEEGTDDEPVDVDWEEVEGGPDS